MGENGFIDKIQRDSLVSLLWPALMSCNKWRKKDRTHLSAGGRGAPGMGQGTVGGGRKMNEARSFEVQSLLLLLLRLSRRNERQ